MDFVILLLPSLLLLLLSLALRWHRVHICMKLMFHAVGWRLWYFICLILELPLTEGKSGSDDRISSGQKLICKPTALAKYLLRYCSSLTGSRLAEWPEGDPHLQTVSSQLLCGQHGDSLQFTREHLLMRDGGIVALDWAVGTRLSEPVDRRKDHQYRGKTLGCFTSTPPVLTLIPQYWGGMSPHLRMLCHRAMREGFYVVVFHHRGTAGCPLTSARLIEFGDPADLEQALSYVRSRYPSSVLLAASEGSGSGVLLSYLGESGSSTHLTAAAAISPVLMGRLWFESTMPLIYRSAVLFQRKLKLSRYASSFRELLDVNRALSCSSLKDFEETLFCLSSQSSGSSPTCGRSGLAPNVAWVLGERAYPAENWESYWGRNEPLRDADEVAIPLLCIRSTDDPLLPSASHLPLPLFKNNPYFFLLLTNSGGHCGFSLQEAEQGKAWRTEDGEDGAGVWSHITVLEFFNVAADFLKGEERDGGGPVENYQTGMRNRTMSMAPHRRKRPSMLRRQRSQISAQRSPSTENESFTWKRSYTR